MVTELLTCNNFNVTVTYNFYLHILIILLLKRNLIIYNYPIVLSNADLNESLTNLITILDFPTPASCLKIYKTI